MITVEFSTYKGQVKPRRRRAQVRDQSDPSQSMPAPRDEFQSGDEN